MDPWLDVRLKARACHAEAVAAAGGERSAAAIVGAALRLRDIEVVPFKPGTRFGPGILGVYERVGPLISVDATLPAGRRQQVVAHEIAHHELHADPVEEVTSVDAAPGVGARIVGYSHRERREMAADVFASEFLCPADDRLRDELVDRGRRPGEIARDLGLPAHVVMKQAIRAVCLPPLQPPPPPRVADAQPLDPAQTRAATWARGPLLVEAGPGTGKTKTLVGRVRHLLASGVPASRILVLTYSTRAAAELRARASEVAPDAAGALWAGTLHAFGLEIVHAWAHRVGRGPRPRVLDRDGALDLLERHLDALPLDRFRDLRDAAAGLAPVLRAIERCKDEMVTPDDYAAAVASASVDADDETTAASEEVAAVYAAYGRLLDAENALDLGDLVAVAARLLEENDDVALHYGARFDHVLVDEIQDVNCASSRLLQALCGPGTCLWAVGDARQSIYRFRGAEPGNVDDFVDVFGGEAIVLDRSYRATPEIVAAFSAFASAMPMRGGPASWVAQRTSGAPVRVLSAPTLAGEVAALAGRVDELHAGGVGYGDQAVLARTHRTLETVGAGLERHGIPVAYLGDLLVRDEVRDLLALLSIDVEGNALGLLRVATLAPYAVPRAAAVAAIRWAAANKVRAGEALRRARDIPGLGADVASSLSRLGRDLAEAGPNATAWTVLATWCLETRGAAHLANRGASPMTRAAIYQLLRLAAEEGTGRAAFLARVRRIAALGSGRDHGVLAPEALPANAVRFMTIHAAKGLEFAAVHLPMASARHLPLGQRPETCPPPPDLARLAMGTAEHDAEERALFFVALSRARDHLSISHARRYGDPRDTRPSPFVGHVGTPVTSRHADPGIAEPTPPLAPQKPQAAYPASELETFLRCPRRYAYEVVDGLSDIVPPSGHRRMTRSVLAAVRRLEDLAAAGFSPTYEQAEAALADAWSTGGPVGHRFERLFRANAERLVARLAEMVATEVGAVHHHGRWLVDVGAGTVALTPHRVVEHSWGSVTVQIVGARRRDQTRMAGRIAALSMGARSRFPDARVSIELVGPDDGEIVEADLVDDDAAALRYGDAITAIERGAFPSRASQSCSACPFFFVCGA